MYVDLGCGTPSKHEKSTISDAFLRFSSLDFFRVMTRFVTLGYFNYMARLFFMDFFNALARFDSLGFLGEMAVLIVLRLNLRVQAAAVRRFLELVVVHWARHPCRSRRLASSLGISRKMLGAQYRLGLSPNAISAILASPIIHY